jgi:hypothetical protein
MTSDIMKIERTPGAGIDGPKNRRPGVPMESVPPHAVGAAHWRVPDRQPDPGNVLRRSDLPKLTPVFGTAAPPRGISGRLRRAAYDVPEHHTSHWLLLLIADRIDALEDRFGTVLPIVLPLLVGGIALGTWRWRSSTQR